MELVKKYKNSYLSYFLMYCFYYLSWALFSVLISVYLLDKGYKPSDVSLVVSTSFLTSMLAQPIIGMLSDKYDVKRINMILFSLAALGGVFFMLADSLIQIMIGYSFVLTLINGTNPVMEKIATASPFQYGKIRIWGTIGYAIGSQIAGLIYDFINPSMMFVAFVFTMILSMIGVYGTEPDLKKEVSHKEKTSVFDLFKNKKFMYYLVIYALFTGMTQVAHTYTPAMFQSEGLQLSFVSTILSVAVLFELPFVFFSNKFMDKIGNKQLMLIAFIATMIQFACYGLDVWMPLKIAATFLSKHPAGMLFIMINLKVVNTLVDPHQQMTALAFCATVKNLSSIVIQNVGGNMLNTMTYPQVFMIALMVVGIGLVLVLLFKIPSGNNKRLFS